MNSYGMHWQSRPRPQPLGQSGWSTPSRDSSCPEVPPWSSEELRQHARNCDPTILSLQNSLMKLWCEAFCRKNSRQLTNSLTSSSRLDGPYPSSSSCHVRNHTYHTTRQTPKLTRVHTVRSRARVAMCPFICSRDSSQTPVPQETSRSQ